MNKITKTAIFLMIVTIISKLLGFTREIVLGSVYGASEYSDIYITTMNIPNVVFTIIGVAISTTFIPLYYENIDNDNDKNGINYTNNIVNILLIIGFVIMCISIMFSDYLVKVFAIGFKGENFKIAVKFTKIMLLSGPIIIMNYIMTAFLQAKDNFIIPGLVSLPFSIITIISIILSVKINIYILPIGTIIAMVGQFLLQLPFAIKKGYRYKYILDIKADYIKKAIWLVGPILVGVSVNQINSMVDRTLASTLVEGSISSLNYANRLNGFVFGLIITSIGTAIYPRLSKLSLTKNEHEFKDIILTSINSTILLVLPISVGAIVLSTPIVRVLFERGNFDANATSMTSIALVYYSIGMIGFGLTDILGKIFYSIQDTKTPMLSGTMAMIINVILNIILVNKMGHGGLALATSISSIVCVIILLNILSRKVNYFDKKKIVNVIFKATAASIIMGISVIFIYNRTNNFLNQYFIGEFIALFLSIGMGGIIYVSIIINCKIEEIEIIKSTILIKLSKIRKRKNRN